MWLFKIHLSRDQEADSNTEVPKSTFQGYDRPDEDQKAMQATLKSKDRRIAEGISEFAPNFVDLADKKLKRGGTMGFILLLTVLRSPITQKIRDMWATEYHNVVVITIPKRMAEDCAFSADTKKAECIVVATKGIGENTGRGEIYLSKTASSKTTGSHGNRKSDPSE